MAGISRTRLRIDQARARFMPTSVDARETDFSDRVNGKRKSYKASSRRRRVLEDGTEEYGELSDEEDGEVNLTRKLARLKREIEEAKEQYGKQKAAGGEGAQNTTDHEGEIASLSQALDEIARFPDTLPRGATYQPPAPSTRQAAEQIDQLQPTSGADGAATYSVTYAPTYEETHALAKAADFDHRLVLLEKFLGIGSSALPELDANGLPRAVLPTLHALQKQISTLSEASTSSLDSISRRVRALAQEADNLEKSRRNAKAARDALASTGADAGPAGEAPPAEESEQAAKINALYGTLPTIENLAPLLPPLLDRLRSLRTIHADAAAAGETLERLENTQASMAGDIKQWRDALEKVEEATKEGEASLGGNMKVVEGWVKELEERMDKIA